MLLNYIKKTLPHEPDEQKRLRKQVWLGAGVGLIISLVVGVVLTVVFYVLQTDVFAGMEALWEGSACCGPCFNGLSGLGCVGWAGC